MRMLCSIVAVSLAALLTACSHQSPLTPTEAAPQAVSAAVATAQTSLRFERVGTESGLVRVDLIVEGAPMHGTFQAFLEHDGALHHIDWKAVSESSAFIQQTDQRAWLDLEQMQPATGRIGSLYTEPGGKAMTLHLRDVRSSVPVNVADYVVMP